MPADLAIDTLLHIEEVSDAQFWIGPLFQRVFHHPAPGYPRHFVAFYRNPEGWSRPIGYLHQLPFHDSFLTGGMIFDERVYRELPKPHRACIQQAGGVSYLLLKHCQRVLKDGVALFGHVGDTRAERVDLRAGYVHTGVPHLIVCWLREESEAVRNAELQRVIALGPF